MARTEHILLTGGAGFLGLGLAARLAPDHRVRLFDRLCHAPALQRARAAELGLELIEGDVGGDGERLAGALAGCTRVVHLASLAGVSQVRRRPDETMRTILAGTMNLLTACARVGGIRRLVLVSSSEVYGPEADGVAETAPAAPLDPRDRRWSYGAAKLAAEHLAMAHRDRDGFEVVVARPFNVYGPGQLGQGAVRSFVLAALAGAALELHNGGAQIRAWCHLDDMVAGLVACLFSAAAPGQVFNLGDPAGALSARELAGRIKALARSNSPLVEIERPGADVRIRVPDISLARRLLGFSPQVELERGLADTLAWYARQGLSGDGPC